MDEGAARLARDAELILKGREVVVAEDMPADWQNRNITLQADLLQLQIGLKNMNVRTANLCKAGGEAVRLCGDSSFRKCVLVGPVSWRPAFSSCEKGVVAESIPCIPRAEVLAGLVMKFSHSELEQHASELVQAVLMCLADRDESSAAKLVPAAERAGRGRCQSVAGGCLPASGVRVSPLHRRFHHIPRIPVSPMFSVHLRIKKKQTNREHPQKTF